MKEDEIADVRFVCMTCESEKEREKRGCSMMDGRIGEGAWGVI